MELNLSLGKVRKATYIGMRGEAPEGVTFPEEGLFREVGQSEPWDTSMTKEKQQGMLETQTQGQRCPRRQGGSGYTDNEEETMNSTPELLMVFNLRCKLILKTRPGEGPWDAELCMPARVRSGSLLEQQSRNQARGVKPQTPGLLRQNSFR